MKFCKINHPCYFKLNWLNHSPLQQPPALKGLGTRATTILIIWRNVWSWKLILFLQGHWYLALERPDLGSTVIGAPPALEQSRAKKLSSYLDSFSSASCQQRCHCPLAQVPVPSLCLIFFLWLVMTVAMRKSEDCRYIQIRGELKIMPTWFCFFSLNFATFCKRKNTLVASNSYCFREKETEGFKINSVPLM